nr:hypothetical protein [Lamprobacter modestohalophilus]
MTQAARDDVSIRLTDQPGELRLPDHFFSQFREAPEAWLSDASLPVLTPAVQLPSWDSRALAPDILLTDPRLPILYGDAETSPGPRRAAEQGDRIDLPLDVFGAAFFMLSRYEEAVLPDRDNHDRFPATASLAQRAGFLDRPIIDEYVEILWAAMQRRWPRLQRKPRQARTLVSCDVDSPFAFNAGSGSRERLATEEHGRTRNGQEAPFPWTSVFFRGKTTAAAGYRLGRAECSVIAERYLGLGYSDQALALMQRYRDTCQRFAGDFTLLWHNSHLGSEADRRFYRALVG